MIDSLKNLASAAGVWVPASKLRSAVQQTSAEKPEDVPVALRDEVVRLWIRPECEFFGSLKELLAAGAIESEADGTQLLQASGKLLNALCDEFVIEVDLINTWLRKRQGYGPNDVLVSKTHESNVNDFEKHYWDQMPESTDRGIQRLAVGRKLVSGISRGSQEKHAKSAMPQIACLATAMAHIGRAAWTLRSWDAKEPEPPASFVSDVQIAMSCLHLVWPLLTGRLQSDQFRAGMPEQLQEHVSTVAMRRMLIDAAIGVPTAAWLTVLHALRWLHGEASTFDESASAKFDHDARPKSAIVKLQFYAPGVGGVSLPLSMSAFDETQCGVFLDLMKTGIQQFDHDLLESLNIAWEVSSARMADNIQSHQKHLAISVVLNTGGVTSLAGKSASGPAALALYAFASGKKPDARVTGSFVIKRRDDTRRVQELADIVIDKVESLKFKMQSAAADDCTHFLLFNPHESLPEELQIVVNNTGILPISLNHDGFLHGLEVLTADSRLEDTLKGLAKDLAGAWKRRIEASRRKDEKSRTDRDENETYRFECYVQPDYRIERTRPDPIDGGKLDQSAGLQDDETGDSRNIAHIPGEDDEKLLHLLRLMCSRDTRKAWDDMPNWLQTEQEQYGHRWLVVYDNAGVGKTIFTHRMVHFLSQQKTWKELFHGFAPLVVRQEGRWPQRDGRYLTLHEFLVETSLDQHRQAGNQYTERQRQQIEQAVRYALREHRVLIVLDGFDQFDPEDRKHVVDLLSKRGKHRSQEEYEYAVNYCRWIVAGRIHAIEEHRHSNELFQDDHWIRVRIDPFTQPQQDAYFVFPDKSGKPLRRDWRRLIGITESTREEMVQTIRDRMDHLLQLPMTLWYLRWLLENTPAADSLPVFRTLSELSLITGRRMLERALETSADVVKAALAVQKIEFCYPDDPAKQLELLDSVLSLLAYQLMLERNYNGVVLVTQVKHFEKRCKDRWFHELDAESSRPDIKLRRKLGLEREITEREGHWQFALAVLKAIELEHRTVTEAYSSNGLAFHSRKMVEANAARYLTRYATEWDVWGLGQEHRDDTGDNFETACAFDHSNDPEWKPCWMLAIEMPRDSGWHRIPGGFEDCQMAPDVTLRSLSVLFEQPKQEIRPNELTYHAWPLFEYDDRQMRERLFLVPGKDELQYGADLNDQVRQQLGKQLILPGADDVLNRFRKSADAIVAEIHSCTEKWDHVPLKGTPEHPSWLVTWQQASSDVKSHTFLQCPPASWLAADVNANVNVMGSDRHSSEKPRHLVRVSPFLMQATPVTRAQYSRFDSNFANNQETDVYGRSIQKMLEEYASPGPTRQSSITGTDNYPIVMTTWYDSWVFCKWLGERFNLPSECQHEFAIRGGNKGDFCFSELPGVTTEALLGMYAWWSENSGNSTQIVGLLRFNDYGLFDVHGQVWEQSCDYYGNGWYRQRTISDGVCNEDRGPHFSDKEHEFRVCRGGSFYQSGNLHDITCARRLRSNPSYRTLSGFRCTYGMHEKTLTESDEIGHP